MNRLFSLANTSFEDLPVCENDILNSVASIAKENKKIVSIELENSGVDDVTGFITEIYDDALEIDVINTYGDRDGTTYVKISSITQMACDGEEEKRIFALYDLSHKAL